jgi:CheY-like chemotaxis protein
LLIVENDLGFARFLLDTARAKGFRGLVTSTGTSALALVRDYQPAAITLDLHLTDIDGWRVLARLKNDVASRHIPVYVVSTEEARERALKSGARNFIAKPIQNKQVLDALLDEIDSYLGKRPKRVLVIDGQPAVLDEISGYIGGAPDVDITTSPDRERTRAALRMHAFDCIVVGATDSGPALDSITDDLRESSMNEATPLVVFSGGASKANGRDGASAHAGGDIQVREVHSLERMLDQTTMLLHQGVAELPERQRAILNDIYTSNKPLEERRVLIVDDDIRNIFALSSVLEEYGMKISSAEHGRDAIDILQSRLDIDIVLMDIMMPEMDGLDTMKEIRKIESCRNLPIVAVTAKAMVGDRERCLEAGAWDYLSKPVDREQLLSVLRAWLQR